MFDRSRSLAFLTAALVGCRSADLDPAFLREVDTLATERTAAPFDSQRLLATDPRVALESPTGELSRRDAVERVLAHNLSLVASAETLAVAQAQLAQAGLLQNPSLGQTGAFLFPLYANGGAMTFDFQVTQLVNGFFTRPYKEAAALAQREQAGIDVARQAFELAQQAQSKYDEMVHLLRVRRLAEKVADSYRRAAEAAEARAKVGIVPPPEVNRARIQYADAQRQVRLHVTQFQRAARQMNWSMGVSSEPLWTLPDSVAETPLELAPLPQVAQLEELGRGHRLDLLRADFDRRIAAANASLAEAGLFPPLTLGFDFARNSDRQWAVGPSFNLTLPIFDQGTVGVKLAEAQQRLVDKTFVALDAQVGQDVRDAAESLRIVDDDFRFYRDQLIPQEEENVALAETSFRLGNSDLESLLDTLREYVAVLQAYEDVVDSHRTSVTNLQRAVGLDWSRIVEESGKPQERVP